MGVPYTGCNPRGLMVARDKALTKKVLTYHNVMTAEFRVFPRDRKVRTPAGLKFPMIVKSLSEEASVGLSQSSVVTSPEKLRERVEFVHEHVETDAIVEEYVEGREITLSLMGTERLQAFPTWELDISGLPDTAQRIATYKVKWDLKYQKRHGVRLKRAEGLSEHEEAHIAGTAKRIYRALGLSGYARMDFRLTPDHELYFLEANPNPDIAQDEEFASSAEAVGLTYPALIQRILNLGLRDSSGLRAAS
jgi:D-alanine-D-alanine ligase